ncbi:MAG: hypothetical protein ABIJ16_13745 [Bacteroidota bacterium]
MRTRLVPIFLIIASAYIFYRTWTVNRNMMILENGTEIIAGIEMKSDNDNTISYSYMYDNNKYYNSEGVDDSTFINHITGDRIPVMIDQKNPDRSVIRGNNSAISFINFNRRSSANPVIVPGWVGYLIGCIIMGFGIFRFFRDFRKTKKIFD